MLGETYHRNPRDLVEPWAFEVVQLWAQCRGEATLAHLPDPGGVNDQAAWLLEAFNACSAAEAELSKEEADRRADQRQR